MDLVAIYPFYRNSYATCYLIYDPFQTMCNAFAISHNPFNKFKTAYKQLDRMNFKTFNRVSKQPQYLYDLTVNVVSSGQYSHISTRSFILALIYNHNVDEELHLKRAI